MKHSSLLFGILMLLCMGITCISSLIWLMMPSIFHFKILIFSVLGVFIFSNLVDKDALIDEDIEYEDEEEDDVGNIH